jgi:O-antigen/teichoic acid export membrane protein
MGVIESGMGWAIFGAAFIFIFILLGILAENQRQKRKLARQELLQKERFKLMEQGMPLPDWDPAALVDEGIAVSSAEAHERSRQMFRLVSLALGYFLAFAGIGLLVAFNVAPTDDWEDIATVGAIPLMAGIGLLLFHYLSRGESS